MLKDHITHCKQKGDHITHSIKNVIILIKTKISIAALSSK